MRKIRSFSKRAPRSKRVKRGSSKCHFCKNAEVVIDYKNIMLLRRYVSARGKIIGRVKTKLCAFHQRRLTQALKRARSVALLSPSVRINRK